MKRFLSLFLTFCILLSLSACDKSQPKDAVSAFEVAAPEYPAGIAFSDFEALRANRKNNPFSDVSRKTIGQFSYSTAAPVLHSLEANVCYSPISLYFALALASSGANGKTREELFALLGASDPEKLSENCGNLYRLLYTDNEVTQLKVANSLWLDNDYRGEAVEFKDAFTKNAVAQFYASLFSVDFASESASQAMSQWIADNTNGTLNPSFEPNPEQIMSIINTIYFRDEWVGRFDASLTKADTFYLANGSETTCDFMNMIDGSSRFSKGEGYTRSALELKSNNRMVFVLPDQGVDLPDLLSNPAGLQDLFEGGTQSTGKVTWKIPKFAYDSDFDLVDTLKNLGVTSAFAQDADFSGITDHQIFISSIVQNTHITIDEKGVEASAFTKIDFYGSAEPVDQAEMILDRPFLYGIFSSAGVLLFIGICGSP